MTTNTQTVDQVSSGANKTKIAYYGFTGVLTLMMLGSAGTYLFNYDTVAPVFAALGFPAFIIYPLAIAKLLGLVAIWGRFSKTLLNLAYAGYMYNFMLATGAHIAAADGEFFGGLMALAFLAGSYISQKKLFKE